MEETGRGWEVANARGVYKLRSYVDPRNTQLWPLMTDEAVSSCLQFILLNFGMMKLHIT